MRVERPAQETGTPRSRSNEPQDDGDGEHRPCYRLVFSGHIHACPVSKLQRDAAADDGQDAKGCRAICKLRSSQRTPFGKGTPKVRPLGDSSCPQLVLVFENRLAAVQVAGRPVGERHRLPADVDDLTGLRPEGSSLGGTNDSDLTVVFLVPVMLEHVVAPKPMGFRRDVRGHCPAAVLHMLVLLAAAGALGLCRVVHPLHGSNLSNGDDSAEGNMPPKKHNVKRLRHTARRTFRPATGCRARMQRPTVGKGARSDAKRNTAGPTYAFTIQHRACRSGAFAPEKHNVKHCALGERNKSHQTYARGELRASRSSLGSDVRLYTVALSPPLTCFTRSDWLCSASAFTI